MIGAFQAGLLGGGVVAAVTHRYWRLRPVSTSTSDQWNNQSWQSFFTLSFFTSVDGSGTDLCLGKTATSYSFYAGFPASLANDNNAGTRWASNNNSLNEWWKVDMVTPVEVHSVKMLGYYSGNGYFSKVYKLQWSDDNTNWTDAATINTANTASLQTFSNL